MPCYSIAVVEDDLLLRNDLVEFLGRCGYAAQGFENATALYRGMVARSFDLALLDILLPGGESGLDIARWLHENLPDVGIIMLTSLGAAQDQVNGLEAGADAYLAKNAPLEVIEATCRSVLRRLVRTEHQQTKPVPISGWRLERHTRTLWEPGSAGIGLTHAEVSFLLPLFRTPGEPISREHLLEQMNKPSTLSNLRNLDSLVQRLRKKVWSLCGTELPVKPSYGIGYLFADEAIVLDQAAVQKDRV